MLPDSSDRYAAIAGGLALIAVVLGALGAHALRDVLTVRQLEAWDTAVLYQLVHALAILIVSLWQVQRPEASLRPVLLLFIVGCVLFSGSIYALALGGPGWLGPVTPLGGAAFIVGWTLLIAAFLRGRRPQ